MELPYEVTPTVDLEEVPAWERRTAAQERAFERRRQEVLRQAAEQAQAARPPGTPSYAEVWERHQRLRAETEARQAAYRANPEWAAQELERLRQERLREIEQYFGVRAAAAPSPSPARLEAGGTGAPSPAPSPVPPASLPVNGAQSEPVTPVGTARLEAGGTGAAAVEEMPEEEEELPALGKLAPLPAAGSTGAPAGAGVGLWAGRWASLTTADEPLYVLLVGINALVELRERLWGGLSAVEQRRLRGSPAVLNALVPPLEMETLASWPVERLLAALDAESERMIRAMEAPLPRLSGWPKESLEEFQQQVLRKRQRRLELLLGALRKRLGRRRAVWRIGELVTRLAWQAVDMAGG